MTADLIAILIRVIRVLVEAFNTSETLLLEVIVVL